MVGYSGYGVRGVVFESLLDYLAAELLFYLAVAGVDGVVQNLSVYLRRIEVYVHIPELIEIEYAEFGSVVIDVRVFEPDRCSLVGRVSSAEVCASVSAVPCCSAPQAVWERISASRTSERIRCLRGMIVLLFVSVERSGSVFTTHLIIPPTDRFVKSIQRFTP